LVESVEQTIKVVGREPIKMEKLVFLRHFRTRIERDKPASEWTLDETGIKEMREMIEGGRFEGFDRIISSTEMKARITAEAISERHGTPIELSDDIVEVNRDYGFIEGNYRRVVERYLSEADGFDHPWEEMSHVRARALRFVERLKAETGNILVVSHGMFLSILQSRYFGQPPADFWKSLAFGQMLEVDYEKLRLNLHDRHDALNT
jgi:broad specificity phosphatase PhoE